MRIALAQMRLDRRSETNFEQTIQVIRQAAAEKARLICFPELQLSPFFPQHRAGDASEYLFGIDDPQVGAIQSQCKESNIIAVPNFYLQEAGERYDASPVIDSNGKILGISKMVHIVQTDCFYEQDYYTPSDSGFRVFDTKAGRIGVVICFDRHYPEKHSLVCASGSGADRDSDGKLRG